MSHSECSTKCYVIFHENWGALWWEHSKLRTLMSISLIEWEPFRFSKWFSFYVMVLIFKRFSFLPTIHRERETGNGHFASKFNFKCQIQNIQLNARSFFIKTEGHSKCMTFITSKWTRRFLLVIYNSVNSSYFWLLYSFLFAIYISVNSPHLCVLFLRHLCKQSP